ncbi:MAG TPA: SRPBCC family protein [Thermoanaerobaculia bacterium]|nr:SRPBCC family protein [Thermoanaerobaculia bacterium]
MLQIIAIAVVGAVGAVVGLAARKPNTFRVERSETIDAPPDQIIALLEDFRRWGEWSPWEKLDPDMKRTHSGAPKGIGAVYAWAGNSKAGAGRMEITESSPSQVTLKLDFTKPFEAHNIVEFKLQPQGNATNVTWSMYGPSPFITKLFMVFMSMEKMVGKDFAAGFANMKKAVGA